MLQSEWKQGDEEVVLLVQLNTGTETSLSFDREFMNVLRTWSVK